MPPCPPMIRLDFQGPSGVLSAVFAAGLALALGSAARADFGTAGVAYLKKHCLSCHGADKPEAGLSLHTFSDDKSVLAQAKLWETALARVESGEMPPEEKPRPTAAETAAFVGSVRGVFAKAEAAGPNPGRVPIRRLNRTEYKNTVRDLLLLDETTDPTTMLPTDPVTLGFDNNAAALQMSPWIMDSYLRAAEMVAEKAIRSNLPPREVRTYGGNAFKPEYSRGRRTVADLVAVLEKAVEARPKDAAARFTLARTRAAAYAKKEPHLDVVANEEEWGAWFGHSSGADNVPFEVRPAKDAAATEAAKQHLDAAIAAYREGLAIAPGDHWARLQLAWCLLQAGDKATALQEIRTVFEAAWAEEQGLSMAWSDFRSVTEHAGGMLKPLLDAKEDAAEIKLIGERGAAIKKIPRERAYHQLDSGGKHAAQTGPFWVHYGIQTGGAEMLNWSLADDFLCRVEAFVESAGAEPVRLAVFAGGRGLDAYASEADLAALRLPEKVSPSKILAVAEITSRSAEKPTVIEVRVGRRGRTGELGHLGIAVVPPKEGSPPVRLRFRLSGEGPLPPESHETLVGSAGSGSPAERSRAVIGRLLPRAFRRPVTRDEIEVIAGFADRAVTDGESWEAGMQQALVAMLCSPKFLYRPELDDAAPAGKSRPLGEFELASRLSYFLWSSMPDEELFTLAGQGKLAANLDAQVRRMLVDPRAAALVDNFALQWLNLAALERSAPDKQTFPKFDDELRAAMLGETRAFIRHVFVDNRPLLDLIASDYTFLNGRIGGHYGVADTMGNRPGPKPAVAGGEPLRDRFVRVQLQGPERGGLLTQASILTMTSAPTRTSPVKRGAWVMERILGSAPPPPPPNVPELEADKVKTAGSLREQLEQHRANPTCAACHAKIDPLGFAFEAYDAVGALRQKEGNQPIDTSGVLPDGTKIEGVVGVRTALLARKDEFVRAFAEQLLTYAIGRGVEYYDKRAIDGIVAAAARDDYRFASVVAAIVHSDPFLMRGREQEP